MNAIDLLVECAACGADPHKPCAEEDGIDVPSHHERVVDAHATEVTRLSAALAQSEAEVGRLKAERRMLQNAAVVADEQRDEARTQLVECQRERDEVQSQLKRSSDETVRRIMNTRKLCEAVDRWRRYGTPNAEADMFAARDQLKGVSDQLAALEAERDQLRGEVESARRIVSLAKRVVSRGIHRRQDHRDVMLREVTLLANDIKILGQLAEAVDAALKKGHEQ